MDPRLTQATPIIVIGMHRSGTRLLAELLSRLGVFMGADLEGDAESVTFMRINEAVFHQCGTFWSEPMPVHVVLAQPEQLERLADLVRTALDSELERYAGTPNRLEELGAGPLRPFGWKDPRSTFTLPVWKRIFPRCRVIHLVRHGIDVAASLARRHRAMCLSATGESVPSPLAVFEDHAFGVLSSRRGWTLAEALAMWEQYVEKGRIETAELGERALEIRFEDLLAEPAPAVAEIARLCGVAEPAEPEALLPAIDPSRARAYRGDTELSAFAKAERAVLERYGYSP